MITNGTGGIPAGGVGEVEKCIKFNVCIDHNCATTPHVHTTILLK